MSTNVDIILTTESSGVLESDGLSVVGVVVGAVVGVVVSLVLLLIIVLVIVAMIVRRRTVWKAADTTTMSFVMNCIRVVLVSSS